jgi:hypothetical protein
MSIIFSNIVKVYNELIQNKFPLLSDKFSLFNEAEKICVVFDLKIEHEDVITIPGVQMYYLKLEESDDLHLEKTIDILDTNEIAKFNKTVASAIGQTVEHHGRKYVITAWSNSVLDDLYYAYETPMLNLIYKWLKDKAKNLFKT